MDLSVQVHEHLAAVHVFLKRIRRPPNECHNRIRQGKEGVVMLPVEQFEQLAVRARQPKSLVQFFRESPLVGLELDFERDKDTGRDIEL